MLRGRDRNPIPELKMTTVDMWWLKPARLAAETATLFFYNQRRPITAASGFKVQK